MFTDNYIKYRKMMFLNQTTSFKTIAGASYNAVAAYSFAADIGVKMGYAYCATPDFSSHGVFFGSGTTPPQRTDYTLASPITSGLKITNPGSPSLVMEGEGKYSYMASFVVQNSGSEDITIGEVGYFAPVCPSYDKQSSVLMDRCVFPVPLVLRPGETKLITYKITCNQTLNVN